MNLRAMFTLVLLVGASSMPAQAGTPISGLLYTAQYSSGNGVWETSFNWDGVGALTLGTPRLIADLPTGAGIALVDNNTALIVAGQGAFCGGCAYKVNIATGAIQTINAGNNNNCVTVTPNGTQAFLGWNDTPLAVVNVSPFSPATVITLTGNDTAITQLAFTNFGTFYTSGGSSGGAFGRVSEGWVTTRISTAFPASCVLLDPFNGLLLVTGSSMMTQINPSAPGVVLGQLVVPNGIGLGSTATGTGHVFTCAYGKITITDYSATGLLTAPSTVLVQTNSPIPSLSGQCAVRVTGVGSLGCNLADITGVGGTSEFPGSPDDQLTVDDVIVFVNLFSDGVGCPGTVPCSRADICGVGGPPEPADGQLTVDDIIAFFNAFSDGCV